MIVKGCIQNYSQLLLVILGVVLVQCSGAEKFTEPPEWQLKTAFGINFYPIHQNEMIILPARVDDNDVICGISKGKGEVLWTTADSSFFKIYYNFTPYSLDSLLVLPIGQELVCINLNNGEIKWKHSSDFLGENHLFGKGIFFYRSYKNIPSSRGFIYEYNILTGKETHIQTLPINNISTSLIRSPNIFVFNKDTFLICNSIEYAPHMKTESNLYVWNKNDPRSITKHLIYPVNLYGKGAAHHPVIKFPDSYWAVENELVNFNLIDKEEKWRTKLPKGILTSKIQLVDKTVLFPAENEYLYAIDRHSGNIKWKSKIGGTPSHLFVIENNIYVIGGSTKELINISLISGKILNRYALNNKKALQRVSYFSRDIVLLNDSEYWRALNLNKSKYIHKSVLK